MNPASPPDPSAAAASKSPQPPRWKRILKIIGVRVLFWYVVICVVLMCMQRQLIYHPERTAPLTAAKAPLPADCVHDISFPTEDGLTLHGWHLLPEGTKCETPEEAQKALDDCRWLVLFFHGNGGDRRGRVDYCQVFTEAGADVFSIDYRGYAENPGSPTESGLSEDARALWKYATETRGVDPRRILIVGESLGGGVAVRLAQEVCAAETPPAGLVVRSTFSSLVDAAGEYYPWLPVGLLLWDRFPSGDYIADVTCPILILHGTEDRIVPYELGQKLFAAAPPRAANNIPKRFVTFEGADHNTLLFSHEREFTAAVEEFLRELAKCDPTLRLKDLSPKPTGDENSDASRER